MRYRLVRGSEVQDFLRCRYRWKRNWVDRLRHKRPEGKLFFGNLFHKFTETYYANASGPMACPMPAEFASSEMREYFEKTDTSRMAQTELDDLWDLASAVTDGYVKQWGEKDKGIRVIATEFVFAIPLANGIAYSGTIDKLWLDEHGKLWFADYKTTAAIEKYTKRAKMDRQISRYFWALKQLANGEGFVWSEPMQKWIPAHLWRPLPQPHGFIYDIVKRDVPKIPEPLKKGGLSKAKNQSTTYATYLQALRDNGLDEGIIEDPLHPGHQIIPTTHEYSEILIHLAQQEDEWGNAFFRRVPVYRQPEELESAIQEFYAAAHEMLQIKDSVSTPHSLGQLPFDPCYRNITDDCGWDCSFQTMCIAQMDGSWYIDMTSLFYDVEDKPVNEYLEVE